MGLVRDERDETCEGINLVIFMHGNLFLGGGEGSDVFVGMGLLARLGG